MWRYILKRLVQVIPVLIGCTLLVFTVMNLKPGDPGRNYLGIEASQEEVDAYNESLGLNRPFFERYFDYMWGICKGDFGRSWIGGTEILPKIAELFPRTVKIVILAILYAVCVGIPLGVFSAVKQYSVGDRIASILAMTITSIPAFFNCLLLLLTFALTLKWLPAYGLGGWKNYILPMVALGAATMGNLLRQMRSNMLEEIRKDYVRTARAKGAKERTVIFKHALRNSLIPVVTCAGSSFSILLGGTVFIEGVFAIPGIGNLIVKSISNNDTPTIMGCVVVLSVCTVLINLGVDIIYAYLDPRIKAKYIGSVKQSKRQREKAVKADD